MRTLYDRLSQESRDKLEKARKSYPTIVGSTMEALENKHYYVELTLSEASNVLNNTTGQELSINNIHDLFSNEG